MIEFNQMLVRLGVALVLGALMGLERELVKKEAGIRTTLMVSSGAAIFSMIALVLPYLIAGPNEEYAVLSEVIARNSGFLAVIANIVVGIGFLGAGMILKTDDRIHGLTTAAVIWAAAAIGVLCGIGLLQFATVAAIALSGVLYLLRKAGIRDRFEPTSER